MVKLIVTTPFEDTVILSKKELAEALGMEYIEAQGFVSFGLKAGFIKEAGVRKVEGKKGKPTSLYAVPSAVQLSFYNEVKAAA